MKVSVLQFSEGLCLTELFLSLIKYGDTLEARSRTRASCGIVSFKRSNFKRRRNRCLRITKHESFNVYGNHKV